MGFLTEMLAVAVVWLSSFALCQFGVAVENHTRPNAKIHQPRTVARSPRDMAVKAVPIAVAAPARAPRDV